MIVVRPTVGRHGSQKKNGCAEFAVSFVLERSTQSQIMPKKFVNIWEENGQVFIKTKTGVEVVKPEWYFCIRLKDAKKNRDYLADLQDQGAIKKFTVEGDWVRIYCSYDARFYTIGAVKGQMETFEADLRLWQRYLVDERLELETDVSVLYFDIETDDTLPEISPGSERITSIAAIDNTGKEYFFYSVKNEKRVLRPFVELIQQYDIISGWHSEGFDLVAIKRRCDLNKIYFDCRITSWSSKDMGGLDNVRKTGKDRARPEKFNHIDLMQKIKEMHYRDTELIKKVRSFSLEAVSQAILGEGKIKHEGITMYDLARKYPNKLKEYNLQDVRLLKKLDDKLHVIQQKVIEHHICGARINDYTSHGKIDPFALRAARDLGERLPTRPDKEEIETEFKEIDPDVSEDAERGTKKKGDYAGGFVFDPETGVHENVHVFDFSSLYPSIIKTFNISIDSWLGPAKKGAKGIVTPTNQLFSSKPGIIPQIIQQLLDSRDQIRHVEMKKVPKDSPEYWNLHYRQYSFKVLANSMYGIMGASFSRYYKRELAEGITLAGQHLIKTVWKWIEEMGHHPIYGDTDSLFIKFKKKADPEKLSKKIDERLQDYLAETFNANRGHLHLGYEATYERFVLVSKKKYAGVTAKKEWKMMGLEAKKRDTLPKAEEWQRELLNMLLIEGNVKLSNYFNWVQKLKKYVFTGKLTKSDLTFQKRLSREVEGYGQVSQKTGRASPIPLHVKIAAKLKETHTGSLDKLNMFSAGSYIPYIVTKSAKGLDGVYAEHFKGDYDKDYYWSACYDPSKRILEQVFKEFDWNELMPKSEVEKKYPRRKRTNQQQLDL